jgi:urease accessory protein UreF
MSHDATASTAARPPRVRLALAVAVVLAVVGVTVGLSIRAAESKALHTWTKAQLTPSVQVISASALGASQALTLPGHLPVWAGT